MDISAQQLKSYLDTFHSELEQVAGKYLPAEARSKLLHLAPLPAAIRAYVSASHGLGWEYRNADKTRIRVLTGPSRIENVVIAAPEQYELNSETAGVMFSIAAPNFTMGGGGTLQWGEKQFVLRLDSPDASCRMVDLNLQAGDWRRRIRHAEIYANKSTSQWSGEKAVERAYEEVLAARYELKLAEARDVPIHEFIKVHKDKTVLVLGSYSDEAMPRLRSICEALETIGYEPVLLKDIPDDPQVSLRQTATIVAGISRFIVVEDSSPSGHLIEFEGCRFNQSVTVILREEGRGSTQMTAGDSAFSKVILERDYKRDELHDVIRQATQWAEQRVSELAALGMKNTYPWR